MDSTGAHISYHTKYPKISLNTYPQLDTNTKLLTLVKYIVLAGLVFKMVNKNVLQQQTIHIYQNTPSWYSILELIIRVQLHFYRRDLLIFMIQFFRFQDQLFYSVCSSVHRSAHPSLIFQTNFWQIFVIPLKATHPHLLLGAEEQIIVSYPPPI